VSSRFLKTAIIIAAPLEGDNGLQIFPVNIRLSHTFAVLIGAGFTQDTTVQQYRLIRLI
jgi:hypothetical protein